MKKIILLTILLTLIACASPAQQLTLPLPTPGGDYYYVNPASGNDENRCLIDSPCKTFNRAQELAVYGDTIVIIGTSPAIRITKAGLTIEGGKVDGTGTTSKDQPSVSIEANDTIIRDMEITGGYSYGWRTNDGIKNVRAYGLRVYRNVTENMENISTGQCKQNVRGGWGSAMRAYYAENVILHDSIYYENCGEGFSSVFSKNVKGSNLILQDNYSVEFYPDQSTGVYLIDSYIACVNPLFQRGEGTYFFIIGAEGRNSVIIDDIKFQRNIVYGCKGVTFYSESGSPPNNIVITNNEFYNIIGLVFDDIPGTGIITSPNLIANSPISMNFLTAIPTMEVPATATPAIFAPP